MGGLYLVKGLVKGFIVPDYLVWEAIDLRVCLREAFFQPPGYLAWMGIGERVFLREEHCPRISSLGHYYKRKRCLKEALSLNI